MFRRKSRKLRSQSAQNESPELAPEPVVEVANGVGQLITLDKTDELANLVGLAALRRRYDNAVRPVDTGTSAAGTGSFDGIFHVTVQGGENRLVVAHFQGTGTIFPLHPRRQIGRRVVEEGTPEYFLDILRATHARNGPADQTAVREIVRAAEAGTLDYMLVECKNLNDANRAHAHFSRFSLPEVSDIRGVIG